MIWTNASHALGCETLKQHTLVKFRDVRFYMRLPQRGQSLGIFKDQFSVHFGSLTQNVLYFDCMKVPDCSIECLSGQISCEA